MASAYQSTEIPLGYSFNRIHTNVVVYLTKLEISDYPMGNVYTTTPLERVDWIRLWYRYENQGDQTQEGYLRVELIDDKGNYYQEPDGTYTGDNVGPHSVSSQHFLEIPVSKGVKIVEINSIQGFENQTFPVPEAGASTPTAAPTITPTAVPSSAATATAQATDGNNSGNCLPLLPFAILSIVGLSGLAAGRIFTKKPK
jgi:hypothetical protein